MNKISMFITLKHYILGLSTKVICEFLLRETIYELSELHNFKFKKAWLASTLLAN